VLISGRVAICVVCPLHGAKSPSLGGITGGCLVWGFAGPVSGLGLLPVLYTASGLPNRYVLRWWFHPEPLSWYNTGLGAEPFQNLDSICLYCMWDKKMITRVCVFVVSK